MLTNTAAAHMYCERLLFCAACALPGIEVDTATAAVASVGAFAVTRCGALCASPPLSVILPCMKITLRMEATMAAVCRDLKRVVRHEFYERFR